MLKLESDTSATGVFVPKSSVAEAPKHPRRRGRLMWPTKLIFTAAIAKSPRKPPTPPSRICISRHDSNELHRLQFGLHSVLLVYRGVKTRTANGMSESPLTSRTGGGGGCFDTPPLIFPNHVRQR